MLKADCAPWYPSNLGIVTPPLEHGAQMAAIMHFIRLALEAGAWL